MNIQKPGKELLVLILLLVGFTIVTSCVSIVLPMFGVNIESANAYLALQAIGQLLVFFVPVVLLMVIYRHNAKEFALLNFEGDKWKKAGVAIVVWLLFIPLIEKLALWNQNWYLGPLHEVLKEISAMSEAIVEMFLSQPGVGHLILNLVVIALIPAITEELFFRCGIQQLLCKIIKNPHIAIILSAVIFSAAHGDVFGFIPRVVLGLLLGYLFYYGGSILLNTTFHFVNNAASVVLYYLNTEGFTGIDVDAPFNLAWGFCILCALAGIGVFVVSIANTLKNEKTIEN